MIRLAYGIVKGHSRDMSQAEISRLVGFSAQAWNNAETGDNRLGLDNAMALCARTGVSLDFIYFGNRSGLPHAVAVAISELEKPKATKRA